MPDLSARATPRERNPKPAPDLRSLGLQGEYAPAKDGFDCNLLIFLHGLGDTPAPFFKLGQSLGLPQTAILSLRAPHQVPFFDGFMWCAGSFDTLTGDLSPNPDPTASLRLLSALFDQLRSSDWPDGSMHLFGFAQGGSVAVELARSLPATTRTLLGSVVSVSGPLLSHPTSATPACSAPVLAWRRVTEKSALGTLKRAFSDVAESVAADPSKQGMPASQAEWLPIMRFWASKLRRKQPWELGDPAASGESGIYELASA